MKRIDLKSACLGAAVATVATLSIAAAASGRTVWEYRVLSGKGFLGELEKSINTSVADGWEFVSVSGPNNENWGLAVLRRERK